MSAAGRRRSQEGLDDSAGADASAGERDLYLSSRQAFLWRNSPSCARLPAHQAVISFQLRFQLIERFECLSRTQRIRIDSLQGLKYRVARIRR